MQTGWPFLACLMVSIALALLMARRRRGRLRAYLLSGAAMVLLPLHANELAGVLTLYLPLTVALLVALLVAPLASVKRYRAWSLQLGLLLFLFGALLIRTGSRGGLISTGLAIVVVLATSGARGRRVLAGATLLAILLIGVAGPGRMADFLVFQGSAQGPTDEVLLSGRLAIWNRGLHAVADFPITGLGVGRFGEVVGVLYPSEGPRQIEDAHNLFLQTALDVGIPGLLVFIGFLAVLVYRVRLAWSSARGGGLRRALLFGWGASLAAHLLYSLTDAVSFGSPGNVAFWLFCGLGLALTRTSKLRAGRGPGLGMGMQLVALAIVLGAAVLSLPLLGSSVSHNRGAIVALQTLLSGPEVSEETASEETVDLAVLRLDGSNVCRSQWLLGLLAEQRGRTDLRDAAWSRLIQCSVSFFEFLEVALARDPAASRQLAALALATWEDQAEACFWLARATTRENTDGSLARAIDLYHRGLALAPGAGRAWIELGNLLAPGDPRLALNAYGQACQRGDPGANGCVNAGRMAERLGEIAAAVRWYRASRWGPSRARALQLEAL